MFAVLLALCAVVQAEPRLWGHLHSGPHAVGFRVEQGNDQHGELHIWYPAVDGSSQKLTLSDYLRLSHDLEGAEPGFEHDDAALRKTLSTAVTGAASTLDDKLCNELLALPSAATRDATPSSGKFPLVFWTHRYATTAAQSVLSEYLASFGFVVVNAPESSAPAMPYELTTPADKTREFARLQTRLQQALAYSRRMPNVQPGEVAVLAWSYAGESAFALQQSEPNVRLVIGLSTNVLAQ